MKATDGDATVTISERANEDTFEGRAIPLSEDFASFYARELRPVVGLAFVISGSRSGAEDIAQDAFLQAYRKWDTVGSYENPGAWVRTTVSNRAVSLFRRKAAEAKALLRFGGSERLVPELSPDAMATWAAVRRLPTRQSQAIALRYYDGSSVAEIGRILGCSENTVRTHLRRAKETLSNQLNERNQP
jgi:RNA polymerase sigma-70 factor (ECF subfamily)